MAGDDPESELQPRQGHSRQATGALLSVRRRTGRSLALQELGEENEELGAIGDRSDVLWRRTFSLFYHRGQLPSSGLTLIVGTQK